MNNLRVNSKSTIAEFKRKHNWLVDNATIKLNVSNIKSLSNDDIEKLNCGDIVLKEDASGKHAYLVTFRNDTGICLTYVDASCVETQSYDKSGNNWVYNSQDFTPIAEPLFESIVDKYGHKRFIEGNIETNVLEHFTFTYAKWSLSGSHLMIVLAGTIDANTEWSYAALTSSINLPNWIKDKLVVTYGSASVDFKAIQIIDSGYQTQSAGVFLVKYNNEIGIYLNTITITTAKSFRFEFDLLIDDE